MNNRFRSVSRHYSIAHSQGVTLIELMISITIGIVIIAGIGYAYLGSRQSFRSQDALSRMQENARTAFEFIAKDIRMTGFRGCPVNSAADGDINLLSDSGTWYKNLLNQPLNGYEKDTDTLWTAFPAGVTGVTGSVAAGDVLTVLHANTDQPYIVATHDPDDFQFTLTADANIKNGELMIAADSTCARTAIFQNSDNEEADEIVQHGSGTAAEIALGSPAGTTYTFSTNSRLYPLTASAYFIGIVDPDDTADSGDEYPALFRTKLSTDTGSPSIEQEELIEDVQDMQIAYAIDNNADKAIDSYVTADALTTEAEWQQVLGIRISLLLVSSGDEQGITNEAHTYSIDRNGDGDVADDDETVTPTDRLLRKVFTTTIAVKNRL